MTTSQQLIDAPLCALDNNYHAFHTRCETYLKKHLHTSHGLKNKDLSIIVNALKNPFHDQALADLEYLKKQVQKILENSKNNALNSKSNALHTNNAHVLIGLIIEAIKLYRFHHGWLKALQGFVLNPKQPIKKVLTEFMENTEFFVANLSTNHLHAAVTQAIQTKHPKLTRVPSQLASLIDFFNTLKNQMVAWLSAILHLDESPSNSSHRTQATHTLDAIKKIKSSEEVFKNTAVAICEFQNLFDRELEAFKVLSQNKWYRLAAEHQAIATENYADSLSAVFTPLQTPFKNESFGGAVDGLQQFANDMLLTLHSQVLQSCEKVQQSVIKKSDKITNEITEIQEKSKKLRRVLTTDDRIKELEEKSANLLNNIVWFLQIPFDKLKPLIDKPKPKQIGQVCCEVTPALPLPNVIYPKTTPSEWYQNLSPTKQDNVNRFFFNDNPPKPKNSFTQEQIPQVITTMFHLLNDSFMQWRESTLTFEEFLATDELQYDRTAVAHRLRSFICRNPMLNSGTKELLESLRSTLTAHTANCYYGPRLNAEDNNIAGHLKAVQKRLADLEKVAEQYKTLSKRVKNLPKVVDHDKDKDDMLASAKQALQPLKNVIADLFMHLPSEQSKSLAKKKKTVQSTPIANMPETFSEFTQALSSQVRLAWTDTWKEIQAELPNRYSLITPFKFATEFMMDFCSLCKDDWEHGTAVADFKTQFTSQFLPPKFFDDLANSPKEILQGFEDAKKQLLNEIARQCQQGRFNPKIKQEITTFLTQTFQSIEDIVKPEEPKTRSLLAKSSTPPSMFDRATSVSPSPKAGVSLHKRIASNTRTHSKNSDPVDITNSSFRSEVTDLFQEMNIAFSVLQKQHDDALQHKLSRIIAAEQALICDEQHRLKALTSALEAAQPLPKNVRSFKQFLFAKLLQEIIEQLANKHVLSLSHKFHQTSSFSDLCLKFSSTFNHNQYLKSMDISAVFMACGTKHLNHKEQQEAKEMMSEKFKQLRTYENHEKFPKWHQRKIGHYPQASEKIRDDLPTLATLNEKIIAALRRGKPLPDLEFKNLQNTASCILDNASLWHFHAKIMHGPHGMWAHDLSTELNRAGRKLRRFNGKEFKKIYRNTSDSTVKEFLSVYLATPPNPHAIVECYV